MTVSSEHGGSRIGGSILVVGAETEEFAPALQVLDSLADTTLVPADEALVTLTRLDAWHALLQRQGAIRLIMASYAAAPLLAPRTLAPNETYLWELEIRAGRKT